MILSNLKEVTKKMKSTESIKEMKAEFLSLLDLPHKKNCSMCDSIRKLNQKLNSLKDKEYFRSEFSQTTIDFLIYTLYHEFNQSKYQFKLPFKH